MTIKSLLITLAGTREKCEAEQVKYEDAEEKENVEEKENTKPKGQKEAHRFAPEFEALYF